MIVGFPAGSGADIFVRYFAEKLRPIAGRTIIVENKVGANSQHRDRVRGALQAGRPRALSVRRHHRGGEHAPVQESAGRRRQGAEGRRHHQQPRLHARGRRQEPVQDRGRADRRDEAEGRQGELRHRREPGPDHGGDLQEHRRPAGGRGAVPQRAGLVERDVERPARLRPARSDLRAGAAARGAAAHPGGLAPPSGCCRSRTSRP